MGRLALATAGLTLAAFVALQLLDGRRDDAERLTPKAGEPGAQPAGVFLRESTSAPRDLRDVVATGSIERAVPARTCPDLEALVAEHASMLATNGITLGRDWIPASSALASELDAHCLASLVGIALDTRSSGERRLAAWSIVAAGERPAPGWSLDPVSRSWLWSCAETPTSWEEVGAGSQASSAERSWRRALVAGAAACCLVRLGAARDRARLVDSLDSNELGQAAITGLQWARDRDVVPAALAVLEGGGRGLWDAALLIAVWSDTGAFELSRSEHDRAVTVLLELWHSNDSNGPHKEELYRRGYASLLLTQLAPQVALEEWRRQVDVGSVDWIDLPQAAQALALRGAPEDLARLEILLGGSDSLGQLKVLQALLESAPAGEAETFQVASARCGLLQIARSSEPVHLRLLAMDRARTYCPEFGELALELLARDPDESVRLKAVVGLSLGPMDAAGVRAALVRAASADSDAAVRREAQRVLDRLAAPSHPLPESARPSGN